LTGLRVLVVGAGVAGLALARALRRRELDAVVVERATEWRPTGTGLYLPGNAGRALDVLGLGPTVAERAHPIVRQRFLDHRGRILADVDVRRVWDGVGGCVAIHRADFRELLRDAAPEVPVRLGTSVTAVDDGRSPTVTFADGSTERYDLVVGADGVHSTIRDSVIGARPPRAVGQASWRFVAEGLSEDGDWTVMLGPRRAFLTVALGGGRTYCYADVDTKSAGAAAGRDWRDAFAAFAEPVPRLLDEPEDAYFSPIEEVAPTVWSTGRVALVGDAAHASSPNMAQGAAMALEDALVLADALAAEQTVERALSVYERRRAPRVSWVQAQTHRRDRTRSLPAPVRNLVLRTAGERIYRSNYRPLLDSL
jgi:2-polyprenyl-6-methoxyphenol hydroxylase-like FAD-dependent oxidoreductase